MQGKPDKMSSVHLLETWVRTMCWNPHLWLAASREAGERPVSCRPRDGLGVGLDSEVTKEQGDFVIQLLRQVSDTQGRGRDLLPSLMFTLTGDRKGDPTSFPLAWKKLGIHRIGSSGKSFSQISALILRFQTLHPNSPCLSFFLS